MENEDKKILLPDISKGLWGDQEAINFLIELNEKGCAILPLPE